MGDLIIRERTEKSLRDFSYVIFRHRRKATWFFLGVMTFVVLVTFIMPEVYRSEAKVLVRLGRESVTLDPTATTSGQVVSVNSRRESEIKSELEILNSQDLAERVVDAIGPAEFKGFLSQISSIYSNPNPETERYSVVRTIMKSWQIEAQKDSNIITIAYENHSSQLAHEVVQKLLDCYLEKHLTVNRTAGSQDFFKEQTIKIKEELARTEKALEEMKNATGIASLKEQRRILLERIGDLQKDIGDTDTEMAASREKAKAVRHMIGSIPDTIITGNTNGFPNLAADGMRQELYKLQLREQELLSKYTPKNFLVQEVKRQISNAESLLKREAPKRNQVTKGVNPVYQQLKSSLVNEESSLAALQAKAVTLGTNLTSAKNELRALNESEVQLAQLQRERDIKEGNYHKYSEKLEQARIDNALDMQKISNISVAQAATFPFRPIRPRKGLNLTLGFVMASLGAVLLAFLAEHSDHSIKRPEDVDKKLKAPLLAAIPYFSHSSDELPLDALQKNIPLFLPGVRTKFGPLSDFEECCETLCDRLLTPAAGSDQPRLIAVTSSRPGEGVSLVASNLALALARRGNQRVLLVEANHLHPSAHKIFGVNVTPGLTDVVAEGQGSVTSVNSSRSANLDVIPSGAGEISLSQLADSKEFAELLSLWKSEYSSVIFDMPAIFKTYSTLRVASLVDGVVLVVEAENVSYEVVQKAMAQLTQANAKVLGIVLNKRKFHIPEWLYRRL